jgi:hypothetical protein
MELLNLPSLVFILEQNDLEKLRNFMLEDLRKNLLKIFALQVRNTQLLVFEYLFSFFLK